MDKDIIIKLMWFEIQKLKSALAAYDTITLEKIIEECENFRARGI